MKKLQNIKRFKPLTIVISDGKDSIHINEWELREIQLEVKQGIREYGQKITFLEMPNIEVTIQKSGLLSESIANIKTIINNIKYVTYGFTTDQMRRFHSLNELNK